MIAGGAAVGAVEGAVGNLVLEPFMAYSDASEQRDWSWTGAFVNVAAGGMLGAGFGAIGGWMGRRSPTLVIGDPGPPAAGGGMGGGVLPPGPAGPPRVSGPYGGMSLGWNLGGAWPPGWEGMRAGWRSALIETDIPIPEQRDFDAMIRATTWNPAAPMVSALEQVSPETRRQAFEVAFAQALMGRAIDVLPVLKLDRNWQDPLASPVERLRITKETRFLLDYMPDDRPRSDPLVEDMNSVKYFDLDPDALTVDAAKFQFKRGGDVAGVTERLQGVKQWEPRFAGVAVIWKSKDGKLYVVDGHQRVALAKRLKAEGQAPKIHALMLDEARARPRAMPARSRRSRTSARAPAMRSTRRRFSARSGRTKTSPP